MFTLTEDIKTLMNLRKKEVHQSHYKATDQSKKTDILDNLFKFVRGNYFSFLFESGKGEHIQLSLVQTILTTSYTFNCRKIRVAYFNFVIQLNERPASNCCLILIL